VNKKEASSSPKPYLLKPLDDAPPSPEQYARFYALAKRVFDEAPWAYLEECQVVAVERNAEETDFISVMGALGSHFAIAVYPSLVCLDWFMTLDRLPQSEASDLFFELPQCQLVFESKPQLFPGEKETIAASGIRFKNGKWPSAQAFVPGYYPWKAGAQGIENLCAALEQLLAVLDDNAEIPFAQDIHGPFLTRFQKDGAWHTDMRKHGPKVSKQAIAIPQDLISAVRALPKRVMCMEIDCFPMMMQVGKKGERAVCPRQLMMTDRASHFAFPSDIITPEEGKTWAFATAIPSMLRQFVKLGFRPATAAFAREITAGWGNSLCELLDIRFDDQPCDALLECRTEMEQFLSRRS